MSFKPLIKEQFCKVCGLGGIGHWHDPTEEHCEVCKVPIDENELLDSCDLEELRRVDNWCCEGCDRMVCPRCEGQPGIYSDGCDLCGEKGWVNISDFEPGGYSDGRPGTLTTQRWEEQRKSEQKGEVNE